MITRPSFLRSWSSGDRERSASLPVRSGKSDREMSEVANDLFSQVALEKAGGLIHSELRDCDAAALIRATNPESPHDDELREVPPSSGASRDDRLGGSGPIDVDDVSLQDNSGLCDLAAQSLSKARKVVRTSGASGGMLLRMTSGGSARRKSVGTSVNRNVHFQVNAVEGDFI